MNVTDEIKKEREATDKATGLKYPRDPFGALLPWAFRNPTEKETRAMDIKYLLDVIKREETDWTPQVTTNF